MQELEIAEIKRKRKRALLIGIVFFLLLPASLFFFLEPDSMASPTRRVVSVAVSVAQGAVFLWAAFTLLRYRLPKDSR